MKYSLLLLLLLLGLTAHAQKLAVSGHVLGSHGEAIPGATVLEKGTSNGTATNSEGTFTLSVEPTATLIFSAVGFLAQQKPVNGGSTFEIKLEVRAEDLNEVVVTGSRAVEGRSNILTTSAVDVITAREIKAFAQTDVTQVLTYVAPSFQSARQVITDGTDHIDPATLRGLGPDQVLVLVNGKRRHTSALVNINGSVGRGSVGTDLNVIPLASIKRIEVLRDGASAQYGSDAIAGVINIQLKNDSTGVTASATGGQTYEGDGRVYQGDANIGIGLGGHGNLDLSGQFQNRGYTNRTFEDTTPLVYLGGNGGNYPSKNNPNYDPDPKKESNAYNNPKTLPLTEDERRILKAQDDALVAKNGFNRKDLRVGNSESRNYGGFLNAGYRFGRGVEGYVSGGVTHRTGKAAGFNRMPSQLAQSDVTIFPNGFLPFINTTIDDQSAIVGLRASIAGFATDLSNTFGRNTIRFDVSNSVNASLPQGPDIRNQTEFYAGTQAFTQNTTNLGLSRKFLQVGPLATLNVAFGGEFRVDRFEIVAGERNSYFNGNPDPSIPGAVIKAPGAQVFPGFQPANALNKSRTNAAAYLDLESDLTEKLLVRLAGRAERYSDFGSNYSGQVAARYSILDALALRGSFGNGFRAPSLQQRYFNNTSTQTVNSVQSQVLTVNYNDPIVRNDTTQTRLGFGVEPLKQEKSVNYGVGLTARVAKTITLTVDAYQIDINDRIVLSSQFDNAVPIVKRILEAASKPDESIAKVQFFANAINTRTRGVDVVISERLTFGKSRLGFLVAANFTETKVQSFNTSSSTINNNAKLQNTLFDRQQRTRIESAQPRSKINLTGNYNYGIFGIEARVVRFGEVQYKDASPTRSFIDQTFSAKWITDLAVSAQVLKQVGVTLGANNLFNIYPDKFRLNSRNYSTNVSAPEVNANGVPIKGGTDLSYISTLDNSNRGRFVYNTNQFGFNGAYYFARLNFTL